MIGRHFVTIRAERQVHYRRAGSGPALILLHQSPASSREMLGIMRELAGDFTVIAPDSPGNGLSDPLPQGSSMADFADALVEFLDEIGIARSILYGFHTGAACVLAVAQRHPNRTVAVIANGYMQLDAAEIADVLEHYLPPFHIEWSGAHLTWSWARIRDQYIFFPWYRRVESSRLRTGLPSTEVLHAGVLDLLRAGDGYRQGYQAAFTFNRAAAVRATTTPTLIMVSRTDALSDQLDRLRAHSASVRIERPTDYTAARDLLTQFARQYRNPAMKVLPPSPPRPRIGHLWAEYLSVDHFSVYCLRNTDAGGRALLFVHDTAGSALGMAHMMKPWIGKRPLLAVDLPGNGESDPQTPTGSEELINLTVTAQANWLARAVRIAGYSKVDVIGVGDGGSAVAWELANEHPDLVERTSNTAPVVLDEVTRAEMLSHDCAPIELDPHGVHLVKVWNRVRDQCLFAPWYRYKRENVLSTRVADMTPEQIHQRTLDMCKCLPSYPALRRMHLQYLSVRLK